MVLFAICGFLSKFVADRRVEGHKAALGMELERRGNEIAKQPEAHKLRLRKNELPAAGGGEITIRRARPAVR